MYLVHVSCLVDVCSFAYRFVAHSLTQFFVRTRHLREFLGAHVTDAGKGGAMAGCEEEEEEDEDESENEDEDDNDGSDEESDRGSDEEEDGTAGYVSYSKSA